MERNSLANSFAGSGGVNGFVMPYFSHIEKLKASGFFSNSVGYQAGESGHNSQMAKKKRAEWYAREWRKQADMTLERASERSGIQVGYLSELEKGKKRWNEDHLAALAHAYGIDPEDLLWNPLVGRPLWRILRSLEPQYRDKAAQVLEVFMKKTGTDN